MIAWLLVLSCSNLKQMPPDLPCREAAFAIASRTEECTGDIALAEQRVEQFEATYTCIAVDTTDPDFNGPAISVEDLFDCAFSIRELPCEVVEDYGDDIELFLLNSDACTWIIARNDGEPLGNPR
ncbi:MAG: hypothetical protein H6742_11640 [Alphaproteobacteria bacterium]|nr:hypothetical protein [Alphaproteobacteria bacterium]